MFEKLKRSLARKEQPPPRSSQRQPAVGFSYQEWGLNNRKSFDGAVAIAHRYEQPLPNQISEEPPHDQSDGLDFWRDVAGAFDVFCNTVRLSPRLRDSAVGREWLHIASEHSQSIHMMGIGPLTAAFLPNAIYIGKSVNSTPTQSVVLTGMMPESETTKPEERERRSELVEDLKRRCRWPVNKVRDLCIRITKMSEEAPGTIVQFEAPGFDEEVRTILDGAHNSTARASRKFVEAAGNTPQLVRAS